jgi:Ca2+/Na+ antiporter
MLKNKNKIEQKNLHSHHGQVQHAFLAPEFLDYSRGVIWYFVATVISLLILALGILTRSFTLLMAFLLFVAVYWLVHYKEAQPMEVAITRYGIRIGKNFFAFTEIENFWLVWKPPFVADLRLTLKPRFSPIITIHVFGQDPVALRELLTPHIKEISRQESLVDLVARALRI